MIADGTGVARIYLLIRTICDDKDDSAWIDLLYADNTEEDILLRDELVGFAKMFPDTFRVQMSCQSSPSAGLDTWDLWISREKVLILALFENTI